MAHLLVDISFHGFGHLSQTAPVVNALAAQRPDLQITVRCAASTELLNQRLHCKFTHIQLALDFGMKMANAVDVLLPESMQAYRAFHADWQEKVAREAEWMRTLQTGGHFRADFFDALTAKDRPYKKPLSPERTIAILRDEAAHNKLESSIIELLAACPHLYEDVI